MGLFSTGKHAYWIQHTHFFHADVYECSSCGREFDNRYKKCPNCGAEMDRGDLDWVDEFAMFDAFFED